MRRILGGIPEVSRESLAGICGNPVENSGGKREIGSSQNVHNKAQVVAAQGVSSGGEVPKLPVSIFAGCTFCGPDRTCSHRRSGPKLSRC